MPRSLQRQRRCGDLVFSYEPKRFLDGTSLPLFQLHPATPNPDAPSEYVHLHDAPEWLTQNCSDRP